MGMWSKVCSVIAIAATCAVVASCGSAEEQGKVYGKVTVAGKPIPAGVVVFSNAKRGVHMLAELRPDGSYELQTANGLGLPLGDYRVAVNPPLPEPAMPGAPAPVVKKYDRIPAKYYHMETSGLALTVRAGENPFNIDMEPSP